MGHQYIHKAPHNSSNRPIYFCSNLIQMVRREQRFEAQMRNIILKGNYFLNHSKN